MNPSSHNNPVSQASEQALSSVRVVLARMSDVLWQADASGAVTSVALCRPAAAQREGELDAAEVAQIEQLWRKAVRCAERFSAVYHVRKPGAKELRNFLVQAVPVFDERDEVRHWSGHATEVERFADSGTRFISEATAVLSSSLNRSTIVNRLIEAAVAQFADSCAVYTLDDGFALQLEGVADRRPAVAPDAEALAHIAAEALRTRKPLLVLSDQLRELGERSLIAVPLVVGQTCSGVLIFVESQRPASFASRELDIALVVARQLALALENIKAFEREKRITERLRFLARITERLFSTLDTARTLELLLRALAKRFDDAAFAVTLENRRLRVIARAGAEGASLESTPEMIAALRERRSLLGGSWMMVPLYYADTLYGAIVCGWRERRYDGADLELLEEVGRRASLAIEHAESFARERRLIQTLQNATLPTQLARVDGATLSAIYRPAASELQVGGDWYDAYDLDDGRVLLTVGDVTGHGLEASVVMGKLRHAINVVALYERNPARILDAAERILLRRYPTSIATAFVAVFDQRAKTLTFANAGHPFPLLRRFDGSVAELAAEGLPLGLRLIGPRYHPVTVRLDDAALLAFYTDGLTEATRDTLAGERRLREALATEAVFHVESPAAFIEAYCLPPEAPDDVAILALSFVRTRRWKFEAGNLTAAKQARHEFGAELAKQGVAPSDLQNAELIFGELVAALAPSADLEVALAWNGAPVLHIVAHGDLPENDANRSLWLVGRLGAQIDVEMLPGIGRYVKAEIPLSP